MQVMIGQCFTESSPRYIAVTVKLIIGIIHLIYAMNCPQATLVESAVVCYQWQTLNFRCDFLPYFWENECVHRIAGRQSVNLRETLPKLIRFGTNQAVNPVGYLSLANDNHPHTVYDCEMVIGDLKINGCEVFHLSSFYNF